MIVKTRSLTESLEKKYSHLVKDTESNESLNEGWMPLNKISRYHNVADEFQVNDKLEIRNTKTGKIRTFTTNRGGQADDKVTVNTKNGKTTSVAKETLKDEIETLRSENLGKSPFTLTDSLNESFVEEWWGQTDEDPFDFAYEYGLTCKEVGRNGDEILYRFTGEKEDFDEAKADGYFYSIAMGGDEGHSEDLNESLIVEAENPDNAEINALIRKVIGKKNISKKDAKALADAGIERSENGNLTGKNGRKLTKWGTTIYGPSKTFRKRPRQRGEDVPDWRKTGKDDKNTRWDLRKNSGDYYGSKNVDKWDKVDLKNYLDSEKPENEWETEQAMDQKLRPYSDKYQELKSDRETADRWAGYEQDDIKSEEEIEKLVQEYRDKLMKQRAYHMKELEKEEGSREFYDKQIKDLQAQAKAKHPQYESLDEAVNPENAEVNAVLRKWANRPGNKLGKKDQKILDDAGIEFENIYDSGNEKVATIKGGKNYLGKWHGGLKNNDKFDAKHYLETDRPSRDDTSYETKKLLRPYTIDYNLEKHFADYYSGRRQEFKDKGYDELEKEYDTLAKEQEKKMSDIVAKAKAKHPQYESLNEAQLNENPLVAAARMAIPAAINVASNAISSGIDAKLHDGDNLNEDMDRADIVNKWWDEFDRDSGGMQLIRTLAKLTNKTEDEITALNTVGMWKKFPDEGFLGYFSTDDIKKSLYGQDNLKEDFYDPTSWFYDLVNNYETWSGEEWNSWSQEERDAAVTRAMKHFLIDNQLSEEEAEEFKHDLADNNFHTECRIFSELYGTV